MEGNKEVRDREAGGWGTFLMFNKAELIAGIVVRHLTNVCGTEGDHRATHAS